MPDDVIKPGSEEYRVAKAQITDKAIWRRSKVLPDEQVVGYNDLPVYKEYIERISIPGVKINAVSRWFNAVSVMAMVPQLDEILKFDFVLKIEGVHFLETSGINNKESSKTRKNSFYNRYFDSTARLRYDYGPSYWQNEQINVPILHYCGITGWGVTLGMCDDGFNWRQHQALRTRNVIAEHDWIFNDDSVQYQTIPNQFPEDYWTQDEHGTMTMSTLCGFYDSELIGPAFDADIYLSKTEVDGSETPVEEDYWVEAVEWMESQGVEVISCSLIYKPFDDPNDSYTYKDMDGNTTVIVRAAEMAVHLGVVVCNSMGNERQTNPPSIVSPPDGDSVISVGAVDSTGKIASFSSNGPTSDGKMKPDVVAMGMQDWVAMSETSSENDSTYTPASGTSFSCPLTSGVCALILSSHPELTPMQVKEALKMTANNSDKPDNVYGWGLVNALDAALYWGMIMSNKPDISIDNNTVKISTYVLSKERVNAGSVFVYYTEGPSNDYKQLLMGLEEILDETNSGKYTITLPLEQKSDVMKFYFKASDSKSSIVWPYGAPNRFFYLNNETNKLEIY